MRGIDQQGIAFSDRVRERDIGHLERADSETPVVVGNGVQFHFAQHACLFQLAPDQFHRERSGIDRHPEIGGEVRDRADVILPGAAYTEKDGVYVNMEGRAQAGRRAIMPPGEAREDWKIIRALSGAMGAALPYNTLEELRAAMFEAVPALAELDSVQPAEAGDIEKLAGKGGAMSSEPFSTAGDHYLINPILRASKTMHDCTALAETEQEATGTDA